MPRGTKWKTYLQAIQQNNGKLISLEADKAQSTIRIRCLVGHEFETQPYRLVRKLATWCPYCSGSMAKIDLESKEKECSMCFEWKPFSEFVQDPRKKHGITANCKACRARKSREFRKQNPEARKRCKPTNEENRAYYHKNKERIKEQRRIKRIENRERITEAARYRRMMDPRHSELLRLRSRLKEIIRKIGKGKHLKNAEDLIGCSSIEFKKHIESQFREGMTWTNCGEWHIDHITPCAAFKLDTEESKKRCFHYSNLRPIWKEENLSQTWAARQVERVL